MNYSLAPIGVVHSVFRERFGIPRQPLLVPEAKARLELLAPYSCIEAVAGLEAFSHLWLTFIFHKTMRDQWQPQVRPPRLGGNRRVGVFASRSPFRPNPIGLSVVVLDGISHQQGKLELLLSGIDLLDGTPVLDIKPYIPYADSIPEARSGYAAEPPQVSKEVRFSETAEAQLRQRDDGVELRGLIVKLLECDPRPAYKNRSQSDRIYGMRLYDFDLKWRVVGDEVEVVELAI
ncbi:MAG: tRNA (N6-threonylcarbamoyladenosine(37)-N6)-methyltransferase TrmO [Candidatus Polarisedimenticolaceae bacterium]|nr:tRNA (N6-threonylcarbamoyladenosine(37)-N6)-methyltransferase TrmO [Candidatus Polarisedimenticolaceae bacterium]